MVPFYFRFVKMVASPSSLIIVRSRKGLRVINSIDRPRNWARIAQSGDEETQKLMEQLDEGQLDASRYQKRNDILYYKYTPVGEQPRLLCYIPKEASHKKKKWSEELWRLQLVLNITKQKTTQMSPLNLLIGSEGTTPAIQALVRDVATDYSGSNRQSLRELARQRTAERLKENEKKQNEYVNKGRESPRAFQVNDFVFVIKYSQSKGKLDPGMRGPYKVTRILENGRYELRLVAGDYGKLTYAAAQYMVPWNGEWTPDECAAFFDSVDQTDELTPTSINYPMEIISAFDRGDKEAGPQTDEDARTSGEAV
ncbi:uncharacterized protein LOC125068314 [Vanessa atalanta]|uniref:uncharacterized protein LOC125068314 n=1 Tax=Vanessa atalanta TaxID=42275 RepID=UPI001FCD2990|nr:uncharacterized protein LOC125068314 [Vanessa atalanta]